ncbi:hypothetical protein P4O66_008138 [Electrophorus voltai]|uniref:Uncharacterized protein n=1 Tax=Electrophorus voltai TaxID=2609070 RepID=A0AAD8ZHS0_9TELE|nr:hypothetical protein P4O66_008138 [Electrophorus voltai]
MMDFVDWCKLNQLQIITGKTKEMAVDFRKSKPPLSPATIDAMDVEVVGIYKYLGIHIDSCNAVVSPVQCSGKTEPPVLCEETEGNKRPLNKLNKKKAGFVV